MLAVLALRADKVACVESFAALDERGHDVARQTLAVTHDGILRLLTQVVNEENALINALELFEEVVHDVEEFHSLGVVGDDSVDHLVVSVNDGIELLLVALVTFESQLRSRNQLVGDTSECTDNHYYRPLLGLFFHNFL